MENAFLTAFAEDFSKVMVVGSDFPDLPNQILEEAVRLLSFKDAVIGPAIDGGYYLIGFNSHRFLTDVFQHVDWGTATVFEQTMSIFRDHDYDVGVLPRCRDIDDYEDLLAFIHDHELTPEGSLLTVDYLRAHKRTWNHEPR
jgi:uncharacterized protein